LDGTGQGVGISRLYIVMLGLSRTSTATDSNWLADAESRPFLNRMVRFCRDKVAVIFNSYQFLFAFLPVVLTGTFLLARISPGAAQYWLIGVSLLFYATWNVAYLPLLLGSIVFNHLIAVRMANAENPRTRSWLLAFAVVVDLGLLGYYKYTGFFLETLNTATGTEYTWRTLILPLGISFYTFQQLTLLADISSGRIKDFRFRDFLLFVTFFPHLIAGPIVHHREMMPQFQKADYRLNRENLAIGFVLLSVGLFKKVILADSIADYVTPIFTTAATGEPVSFLFAWAGAVGFTLQMYFDFSGYSEMALGLARMVGVKLPMNFNSPLKALSVVEYWSRWHITLTRFLTAYVYNPIAIHLARRRAVTGKAGLTGARISWEAFFGIVAVPTVVTMVLSGLWHGAGNQFLLFGVLHGVALVINHAWRLVRPRFWPDTAHYQRTTRPLAWLLTFLLVTVALTWFHAASVAAGGNIVAGLIGMHGVASPVGGGSGDQWVLYGWIVVLMAIALVPPNVLEILRPWQPAVTMPAVAPSGRLDLARGLARGLNLSLSPIWAFATAMIMVIGVLGLNRVSEFLYWRF
jgi:alginate O-acetyltransferase complex protein AlgI